MGGSTPLHGERQEIFRIVVVGATLRTDLKAAKHWLAAGHGEGSPPREQAVEQEAERVDGRHNTADLAPDRHPRRAPGWWALGLTAVACLAIGRATVPRDEPDPPTLALPARLRDDDDRPETPTPSPVHTPLALATDESQARPVPRQREDRTCPDPAAPALIDP